MVGWGRPVRECPEGQTAYIGFTRDQICNNYGSPQRVLAKKKKKKKLTMALIPEKALPSASFCRQYCSRNQPDCLLPGSPSRLPLGCSRYITAGGWGGWGWGRVLTFKGYGGAFICTISSETEVIFSRNCASYL